MPAETIFAWTGPTPPEGYPAFVNISRDEGGITSIMVRGAGGGGGRLGCTELPPEVLRAIVKALLPPMAEYGTEAEGDAYTRGWFDGNEADPYGLPRWRHKARGTHYTALGVASLQAAEPVTEGCNLMVYRGDDDQLWARPESEFRDGRFEQVTHGVPPCANTLAGFAPECGPGNRCRTDDVRETSGGAPK